jgi:molybdopterin molybdotransferase
VALGAPPLANVVEALDDCEGRVLGEDLVAPVDLPGFDYSSMDGYAIRAGDLEGEPPYRIAVHGESRTGSVPGALAPSTAMRIFTGAALPEGADGVVMQENVAREGDMAVITSRTRVGQNVRRRGEDLRAGAVAVAKGTRLRPAHLALAASLDRAHLAVAKRPEVVILATGDELRRPGTDPVPGTIPESNTVALRAMARRAGAHAVRRSLATG